MTPCSSLLPTRCSAKLAHRIRFSGLHQGIQALLLVALSSPVAWSQSPTSPSIEDRLGDPNATICLVGNTLAERMQHHAWLETSIQTRFPDRNITFRNLGFSGDELELRLRSSGFGSPDEHLKRCQASVVWAFFGFNESFRDEAGLPDFERQLRSYVEHLRSQTYDGKSPPRIVLFTPIAWEAHPARDWDSPSEGNRRLQLYTDAIRRIGQDMKVPVVDLFTLTQALIAEGGEPLTINGLHLSEAGDRRLAERLEREWFGNSVLADSSRQEQVAKIRAAVLDKNFHWFNRYRTVDGYSIYGGRADLRFVDGQSNRDVMNREMEILDVMTANRDRHIWSVSSGSDAPLDDSNLPPFLEVISNKQGPLPGGKHEFVDPEKAIDMMTPGPGLKVELFASEKDFPELANPVQMAFDPQGRLFVAVMPSYPHWKPGEPMDDKILMLEDTDGDGRADRCVTFAGGLHVPTGLEFWGGGLLVGHQPDLMFLKDTDGDDVADVRERVLHGLDSADTHHAINSFAFGPGGDLFFQEGTFHHTQVETPQGPVRSANAAVFRYEPRTHRFSVHVAYGFANPHGNVFDRWGQQFVTDGTGAVNYFATAFSGHVNFPDKHPGMRAFFPQRTRPCPATEILSSAHFPADTQGDFLIGNVIGVQGILRYRFQDEGSGFTAFEVDPIVVSSDPNFRPVDLEIGPDGAIWFCDWQNPLIGHMQHNLRDPNRDQEHGRVYRVVHDGRPLSQPPAIAGTETIRLVELLAHREDRVRYRVKLELSARPRDEVIAAVDAWVAGLTSTGEDREHDLLEALWTKQFHGAVDLTLLEQVLKSPDPRARAAGVRVLWAWRERIPDALDRITDAANDEHPRVRLEAVRAASFFDRAEAIEAVIVAQRHPSDYYLDYTSAETMRTLDPIWKRAVSSGMPIAFRTPEAREFLLQNLSLEMLLAQPRTLDVHREITKRAGVQDEVRRDSLEALAADAQTTWGERALATLESLDREVDTRDPAVLFDLVRLLTSAPAAQLTSLRDRIETLATEGRTPIARQAAYVAMMQADRSIDAAFALASGSISRLRDFVTALPAIPDPGLREALYPSIAPLLNGLPAALAAEAAQTRGSFGRYVRIELPRRGTLTLAEVEVFADGRNVARQGKASQSTTSNNGEASRGVDGNRNPAYGGGGQTHSVENTENPWWEVDLGEEYPIDSIAIFNRVEGDLGRRLDGFRLSVLDASRQPVFEAADQPAPAESVEFRLEGGGPEGTIRRAAMLALTSVRGREAETFSQLARFYRDDIDAIHAARAMLRIPARDWPAEDAVSLVAPTLARLAAVPTEERTGQQALDLLQLAEAAANALPADQARETRRRLRELGVRMIRLSTVPHRMVYDQDVIVVEAGKAVEIVFENTDIMPHNVVFTRPGALEQVGMEAEEGATAADAVARHYVPASDQVLLASRLLQPRERQTLAFTAPAEVGVYPYVCTYPGHWRRMYGALYVVDDLDAYLENPTAYLEAQPLEIRDPMLADRRPRTTWTLADLTDELTLVDEGRSFEQGRELFRIASCAGCHQLAGLGVAFGPDLKERNPEWKTIDILKEILHPSERINEKFRNEIFELESGETLAGLVLEESPQTVKLVINPLADTKPIEILKSEIASREVSPVSPMPEGLLDKLTREEILDLLAFVMARGDATDPRFQGGHDHAGHGSEHGASEAPGHDGSHEHGDSKEHEEHGHHQP